MKPKMCFAFALIALIAASACKQHDPLPSDQRPSAWAEPLFKPGLDNFHKVSEILYRGAQPEHEGFASLSGMGIKTVINLRSGHSDEDEIGDLAVLRIDIPCEADDPDMDKVVEFLKAVTDRANHPVFVHCAHGSDRTGLMCASYRVAVQGWTREQALEEMKKGGFGFHTVYEGIVRFIEKMDAGEIRARAGIK